MNSMYFPHASTEVAKNLSLSFGFLDGISQPAVAGVGPKPNPGQETVPQGIMLLGRDQDTDTRPAWALDGSFLSFRYLTQLVPEFNEFLAKNPTTLPGIKPEEASQFTGARMVGRWKSGKSTNIIIHKPHY